MRKIFLVVAVATAAVAIQANAASGVATAGNAEIVGKARFTLLTDRMVRCEWSEDGEFEDRPSITFINRDMSPVKHTLTRKGDGAVIETDRMRLEWTGGAFNESNLVVSVANVEMLPMVNANVANEKDKPNWKLGIGIGTGNIGNNGNIKNDMTSVAVLSEDKENLLGTMRTIDGRTSIKDLLPRMEKGILSRRGVTVVDDTKTPLFVKGGDYWKTWVEERPLGGTRSVAANGRAACPQAAVRRVEDNAPYQSYRDLTIFAYGHDYKGCLGDYVKVAGRIPLPPRWAFGYWWSRFWNDTESDYRQIVREMNSVGIPMDVCVIEMYWHENWNIADRPDIRQPQGGQMWGWGGYTWNRRYFPDPARMFRFLHDEGLHAPLNMHPACGIPDCEEVFPRFAKDYGWKGGSVIPFRGDDERWAEVYFKDVVEPLEALGADFFWLDWQQWLMSKDKPSLSNTFWLNHLFFEHSGGPRSVAAADGTEPVPPNGRDKPDSTPRRPIIYHRWGGLGSHRYQIGFSGDGESSWRMLEAIPWFTATASNVGYGYWGHDLGGHNRPQFDKKENGELFTRWMQCGVFTPIFRTHPSKDSNLERRPWKYADHFFTLRETYRLRYRLAPYIYTAAREAYDTGVCLCRPMYYDWPEEDAAYEAANQYMFGDDILVAPVMKPVDPVTKEAEVEVWLPKGEWYDVSRGELVEGGRRLKRGYTIEETPWFVKAGAVIPMYPDSVKRLGNPGTDDLVLFCAPGGWTTEVILPRPAGTPSILEGELHGSSPGTGEVTRSAGGVRSVETSIYEDGGDNADYATNFRRTAIRREGNRVTIAPRKGAYTLKFPLAAVQCGASGTPRPTGGGRGATRPTGGGRGATRPTVLATVNGKECAWEYDAEDLAVVVKTPPQDGTHETVVELVYSEGVADGNGRAASPLAAARRVGDAAPYQADGTEASPLAAELSGLKGEHTRIAALTDDFRDAIANMRPGPGGRSWPAVAANLPDSWQIVWKTRDMIAEHPTNAQKLLAERSAALKVFVERDWPRIEKTLTPEFVKRMRAWLLSRQDK